MGETGAFIVGGLAGGAIVGGITYQAGYEKREQELRPHINDLERQVAEKDSKIAELERQLRLKEVPVLSRIPLLSKIRSKNESQ